MDTNQMGSSGEVSSSSNTAKVSRGLFGTNLSITSGFLVGILLFMLPFSEIKCGGSVIASKSGMDFCLGSEWKSKVGAGKDMMGDVTNKTINKEGNAQVLILVALAFGVIGAAVSFIPSKKTAYFGVLSGVLAAGSLVALMIELKRWFKDQMAKDALDLAKDGADGAGLGKMGDSMIASVSMTPWFYLSVIAFLAAAFFSYRRISAGKK